MFLHSFQYTVFTKVNKILGIGNNLPLKWNRSTRNLTENFDTDRLVVVRKCHVLYMFTIYFLVQLVSWLIGHRSAAILDKIQIGIAFVAFTTSSANACTVFEKIPEIILCTNGHFQFLETRKNKRYDSHMEVSLIRKLNLFLACGVCFGSIFFPFAQVYVLHWFNPCLPSLVGYWIVPECQGSAKSGWDMPAKIAVLIFNHAILHVSCQWIAYVIAVFLCLGIINLVDCLKLFWVSWRDDMDVGRLESSTCYRELQLLGNLSNTIQQRIVTPSILVISIVVHALCLAASVLLIKDDHLSENWIALAYFVLMTVDILLLIVVLYGGMSCVYRESKYILKYVKQCQRLAVAAGVPRRKMMWQRIFFRSCAPLKIKFGANNFVDELTLLNSFNFSLGLVVQLLLLKR